MDAAVAQVACLELVQQVDQELDATVVRALIVPAVVALMGRWNWWLPPGPAKLLRVEPSVPQSEPA